MAPSDREGRDGINPSTTHLRIAREKMCRRGACPLATLAVAGSHGTSRALQFTELTLAVAGSHGTSRALQFTELALAVAGSHGTSPALQFTELALHGTGPMRPHNVHQDAWQGTFLRRRKT